MSLELPEYRPAPCLPIPEKQFFVVEYPGYVRNIDKVLKTLGGQRGLNKAINEDLVELRYRSNDPFCHPINGDIVPTANLLVKVTRRRRKKRRSDSDRISISDSGSNEDQEEEEEEEEGDNDASNIKTKVLGIITKTCRFRGMADFQHILSPNNPILKFQKSLGNFEADEIIKFDYKTENEEIDPPLNLPPPFFSRIECPMDYGYQQNSAVIKVMVQKDPNQPPIVKLINRSRRKKFVALSITYDAKNVPDGPPEEATKHMLKTPQENRDRVKKLFEERPIWTRLAIEGTLEPEDRKIIKKLLPLYAYWMVNGPWRDCWIRYGYNPKKHQEARFYQLLDVRNNKRPVRIERAKRILRGQSDYLTDAAEDSTKPDQPASDVKLHIFDGKTKSLRDVAVYQVCDIQDKLLRSLIDSPDGFTETCEKQSGFYKHSWIKKLRKIMRRKVSALDNGVILPDDAFDDLMAEDESAVDEDGGADEDEINVNPTDERVNELMRSLQQAQAQSRSQDFDQDGVLYQIEDFEDLDMFGEDEDPYYMGRDLSNGDMDVELEDDDGVDVQDQD